MKNGQDNKNFYEFDEFRLDANDGKLWRGTEQIALTHKAIDLLTLLIERRGETLSKNEIIENLWRDTYVDENNLAVTVSTLRKAFGEKASDNRFIETVPRRGYRFVADVREPEPAFVIERQTLTNITIEETEKDAVDAAAGNRILERRVQRQSTFLLGVAVLIVAVSSVFGYLFWTTRTEKNQAPLAVSTNATDSRTIAVLPFKNLNKNEQEEFMNVGLTDALITKLGGVRGLIVRPTSSVLPFADAPTTAQTAGEKLGVENVLEGTIQKDGERLRVSVQLVRAVDGAVVWSNRFDENLQNVFKIQDSLSAQVADALLFRLSKEERELLAAPDTENAEAYRLYLKGRFFWNKRTPKDLKQAADLFEQAVALDNRYAQAYAGIGSSYILLGDSGFGAIPPDEAKFRARAAMEKALELDPNIPEAYAVLGNLQINYDWDRHAAEKSFRRAIELNPSFPTAHHWLGWCLIAQRRFEEAEAEFKRASELDPTSMSITTEQGYPAFFAGDLTRAENLFRQAVAMDGSYAPARMNLWRALHHAERFDETMPQIEATESIVGKEVPIVMMARARTLATMGKKAEAEAIYQKLQSLKNKGEYLSPIFLAILAADLDNRDETFRWLEECFKERNDYLLFLPIAPEFKRFQEDSRFQELLAKVGA